ncbi:MAG: hypothetical protein LCH70_08365 [Proteobacteria bacterium]|nr:hypothetical protein [Pseudomonadota bacterium]
MSWDPLQRGILDAMGYVLYAVEGGDAAPAATPAAVARRAPPRDAADGAAALLHALLRAAGQSVDDADARARCQAWLPPQGLRDVAARRALWPRLRAMRRGPTA